MSLPACPYAAYRMGVDNKHAQKKPPTVYQVQSGITINGFTFVIMRECAGSASGVGSGSRFRNRQDRREAPRRFW